MTGVPKANAAEALAAQRFSNCACAVEVSLPGSQR
jgi:hypothetical protein